MAQSGNKQLITKREPDPTPQATQNLLFEQIGTEAIKKTNTFTVETSDGGAEGPINPLQDI